MLKQRAKELSVGLLSVELLLWGMAFFGAHFTRASLPGWFEQIDPLRAGSPNFWLLGTALVAWVLGSSGLGLRRSYRTRSLWDELWDVGMAAGVVFVSLAGVIFLAQLYDSSRLFIVLFAFTGFAAVAGTRIAVRMALLNARALGFNYRSLVVVGDGSLADGVADVAREHRAWGLKFIGFVSMDGTRRGPDVLGRIDEIERIVDDNVVDEVVFAVDNVRLSDLDDAFRACEETGVNTRIVLNFVPHRFSQPALTDLDGIPLLSFHTTNHAPVDLFLKRVFDVAVASALLVLTAPVLLFTALAIKLDSRGPVFFVQQRLGLNGREFGMLKFRSMVPNAEALRPELETMNELQGPAFKIRQDPRVTRLGRFLRRTSIDELPQFLNVLLGEMSVVGPRPPVPSEVVKYERWQRRRLSVKPGITCIWQVSGRNNVDFERWMRMDMNYIENWSLWLDLKICFKTIPVVLFGRGAS